MSPFTRRRGAIVATLGLSLSMLGVGVTSSVVHAAPGTLTTTNACKSSATGTFSDLQWTLGGTAAPNPITLGTGDITLSGGTVSSAIPATILLAGYNLGLLTTGLNNIPTTVWVARSATNVDIGGGVAGTKTQVDVLSLTLVTTITDPDGIPATLDETATPLAVNEVLPNFIVTPLGGNVAFSQAAPGSLPTIAAGVAAPTAVTPLGSIYTSSSVAGGLIKANFDCQPGTANLDPPPATSGPTFTPAASIGAFENGVVVAPATAPVCSNETASVGVTQAAPIDISNNCSDVNEAQGGGSPFTYTTGAVSAGTLDDTGTLGDGIFTYTAPATDPGAPIVVTFTATDASGLTSAAGSITITILANSCDASTASCSLTEIVVQPVIGATMTLAKAPGLVVMSPVFLNGAEQVSTGTMQGITITNARGNAASWSVTAYMTDLGAAGSPTFSPLPGVTVPLCSNAGAGPFIANPALAATIASNRLCIPGDNMGWVPTSAVTHNDIPGDVAAVVSGPASAADAAAWLALLVTAGNLADPGVGVDGIGGLLGSKTLCSAPVNQAGGTFTCSASLFLGVPASAGAGTYTGGLVLTLV
ncbi:MAG: Htaa domain-containing protein [Acidimicrobiaceae bacterium]|nr:MAG: Htaa domain-containing protein [Acidimicrobiaceae bacterium]